MSEEMKDQKSLKEEAEVTESWDSEAEAPPEEYWKGKAYSFFQHRNCEFFPCHETKDPDNFNCLFCYCPLYALGDNCGGNFRWTEDNVKDCSQCMVPHKRNNFGYIMKKYGEIIEVARSNHKTEK